MSALTSSNLAAIRRIRDLSRTVVNVWDRKHAVTDLQLLCEHLAHIKPNTAAAAEENHLFFQRD